MTTSDQTARKAAPASEEIHLPGPSGIPLVTAIAITAIVVGTVLTLWLSAVGALLLVACIVRWIGDTRRDVAALPEQHEE